MAAPIPYVRDLDIAYGRVDQVSPLIRRVVADNPSKFTYLGTGTYLVGHGDVVVIDPGPLLDAHVDAIVAALEPGEHITHLLVTHTHSDHSPATAPLKERTGAPSYGYGPHGAVPPDDPDDRIVFGDPEADGTPKAEADGTSKTGEEPSTTLREGADTDFAPDVVLRDGDVVAGPGWTIQAVYTPGHTSNHLCYALREEGALFSGDHVMGWSTSVIGPPDGSISRYLASLRLLLDRDDAVYWPTHGPAVTEPRQLVQAYLTHREERTQQIVTALRDGPATLTEIVPRIYAEVPKTLWVPAAMSTYAHVLQLIEDGTVQVDGGGDPKRTAHYALTGAAA
jgi:glyoxylase-like metal-dependent hydrolase (beta-lactamase superfamily II)